MSRGGCRFQQFHVFSVTVRLGTEFWLEKIGRAVAALLAIPIIIILREDELLIRTVSSSMILAGTFTSHPLDPGVRVAAPHDARTRWLSL